MTREAEAWNEGYITALRDFDVTVNDETMARASKNPHAIRPHGGRLSGYERFEIRNALGYHFEDCPGDWDLQTEIVTTIVERILSRRPERGA